MSAEAIDFGFLESKLRPPWSRPGLVARTSLIDQLLSNQAPIVVVVAPPGYGKTTLLSQLQERSSQRTAWVSLDQHDNDSVVLFKYLAAALDGLAPAGRGPQRPPPAPNAGDLGWFLRRIAAFVASVQTPFNLTLDHVEAIESQQTIDAIAELAFNLPPGSRLTLASRRSLPLPMGRLRAQGSVVDVGIDDLAMDEAEARALFHAAGVEVSDLQLQELLAQTEGWPVGLYLATLAIRSGAKRSSTDVAFRGNDRVMAEYLRAEVLKSLPAAQVEFLRTTSVLDRLCGPLCDAVVETRDSHALLDELAASNLLIVPLDREGVWYRCHNLLRELLKAELSRGEPGVAARLHGRAADWFEANGHEAAAVEHALAADDEDRAARLIASIGHQMFTTGQVETLLGWLGWFDAHGVLDRHPHLAVLGAVVESVEGHPKKADWWALTALSERVESALPDGSSNVGWIAVLEAYMCRRGVDQMRADAERALACLAPRSPWRSDALSFEAISHLLQGDLDAADDRLEDAVEMSLRARATPIAARALAERAVVAIERRDWNTASTRARDALEIVEREHFESFLDSTVVLAVAARVAAHNSDIGRAKRLLSAASQLRPKCTYFFPLSAHFLVQLANGYLEVADPAGAQAVLDQIRAILEVRPDLGLVPTQADELEQKLRTIRVETIGASTLTAAELRVLPLLATHLTLAQIAERLYIARNTVKTEAVSIYRKLGVTGRSDAVRRAEAIGLLTGGLGSHRIAHD